MKFLRSIKMRLLLWQMLLLAVVLTTLLSLHYHQRYKGLLSETDTDLHKLQVVIMPFIAPMQRALAKERAHREFEERGVRRGPPGEFSHERRDRRPPDDFIHENRPMDPEWEDFEEPIAERPDPDLKTTPEIKAEEIVTNIDKKNMYLKAWTMTGKTTHSYGNVPESLTFDSYKPKETMQLVRTREGNRELLICNNHSSRNGVLIVIGRPLERLHAQLAETKRNLILIGIIIFIIAYLSGILILNRGLKPINQISDIAKEIAEGDRDRRIELTEAPDELEGMAMTLNKSFDSLDESIKRQAQFTADASHELRTPISVIMAQTQATLRKERTAEQYISTLEACLRAGKRMKTLSESLLNLTRIDAQGLSLDIRECELAPVLSDAAELSDGISDKHTVEYISSETSTTINADKDRVHQSVVNLISNAIKYNPDGCRIELSLEIRDKTATIRVSDNGVGIPPEHIHNIFNRFYRVDKSRSRESGGSGLGLSIVKCIVEAHGGTITAESIPDKKTTFTILLPKT